MTPHEIIAKAMQAATERECKANEWEHPQNKWDDLHESAKEYWYGYATAILSALKAEGYEEPRKTPKTIGDLQARIGVLQSQLHWLVCGDPRKSVSLNPAPPDTVKE